MLIISEKQQNAKKKPNCRKHVMSNKDKWMAKISRMNAVGAIQ